jgi:hypothetical protein
VRSGRWMVWYGGYVIIHSLLMVKARVNWFLSEWEEFQVGVSIPSELIVLNFRAT